MPPTGFEPTIPASELPQSEVLDSKETALSTENVLGYLITYLLSY